MSQETPITRDEIDAIGDRIAETAACIDAATHTLLTHIRQFDEVDGWYLQGALSCAHWLQWRAGIAMGAAREKVRVAKCLGKLPLFDDALRKGEVSYSKVRAMTRVATPENEKDLLEMARCSTAAQLEKLCGLYRPVKEPVKPDPETDEKRRWVCSERTDNGMVRITARLHPEEAERVMKAIQVSAKTLKQPGLDCDLGDGLVAMADAMLEGETGRSATEAVVRVNVDAETMEGQLEDGTGLSAETSRRLCCDAGIVPVTTDGEGTPLSVGRKKRTVSTALRRALTLRDGCCQFPGCTNEKWLDAHHIEHWADGGETCLENLLDLCRRHHRFVHEYGFSIEKLDGDLLFRDPRNRVVPITGEAGLRQMRSTDRLREALARSGIEITANTNLPNWDGRRPDYDACVDVLTHADGLRN